MILIQGNGLGTDAIAGRTDFSFLPVFFEGQTENASNGIAKISTGGDS